MFSPLLNSIIERHGYAVIREADLASATKDAVFSMLFFAGDHERLAESNDVAVIIPELMKVFGDAVTPIVVARDAERALQRMYRFSSFPSLVFLRHGEYLGAISRIRDWGDYLIEIPQILSSEPSVPPPFKLPTAPAANGHGGDDHGHEHQLF